MKEKVDILKIDITKSQSVYLQKTLKDIKACTLANKIQVDLSDKCEVEIK